MSTMWVHLVLISNSLDPSPEAEDVKAGWVGFGLFLILLVVVGLLGWSLKRHLRNVESNRRTGVYGDAPEVAETAVTSGTSVTSGTFEGDEVSGAPAPGVGSGTQPRQG